jgi:hypothetical protein
LQPACLAAALLRKATNGQALNLAAIEKSVHWCRTTHRVAIVQSVPVIVLSVVTASVARQCLWPKAVLVAVPRWGA